MKRAMFVEGLSSEEVETVRRSLRASVQGSFFPDWEFHSLFGVDRKTVEIVLEAFPQQTVEVEEFRCALFNSLNNLLGYPHGKDTELNRYVPEGRDAIQSALHRLGEADNH